MFTRAEKNYFLDTILLIFSLVCIVTGFLLHLRPQVFMELLSGICFKQLHILSGYLMTGTIIIHLAMHLKWIQTITKVILQNRKKALALFLVTIISIGIFYGPIKNKPTLNSEPPGKHFRNQFR